MSRIKVLHIIHWPKSGIVNLIYNQVTSGNSSMINYKVGFFIKDLDTFRKFNEAGIEVSEYDFSIINYFGTLKNILKDIHGTQPAIVHTHSFLPGLFVRLIKFRKSYKIISTIHNSYPYFTHPSLKNRLKSLLEIFSINVIKHEVIAVSKYVKQYLIKNTKLDPNLIHVIYPGIKLTDDMPVNIVPYQNRVIIVGRLDYQKRHDRLLHIWKQVLSAVPDAILDIAGDGSEKAKLVKLASFLKIDNSINFLGFRDDIPDLLQRARLSVLVSDHEGLPLAILESFSRKRPVIAFNVGPLSEIIDSECGILVTPFDINEFAEKIVFLLSNPLISNKMGENGYQKVIGNFNIENMVNQIEKKYVGLCNG
jgi:glycosyltransferase involved in cell wall biosynthesis